MGGSLSSMGSKGSPEGLDGRRLGPATPHPWTGERAGRGVGLAASSEQPWSRPPTLGTLEVDEGEQDQHVKKAGRAGKQADCPGTCPAHAAAAATQCRLHDPATLDPTTDGMLTWTLPADSLRQALAAEQDDGNAQGGSAAAAGVAAASPPFAIPPPALPAACRGLFERNEWCLVCEAAGQTTLGVQLRVRV